MEYSTLCRLGRIFRRIRKLGDCVYHFLDRFRMEERQPFLPEAVRRGALGMNFDGGGEHDLMGGS
jgi:hypothetical protein